RYEVTRSFVVKPTDVSVLARSDDNRLTLTTCEPRYSAAQRLIVVARLVGEAKPPPPPLPVSKEPSTPTPTVTAPSASARTATPDLVGDSGAWPSTVLFGLLCAAIWAGAWLAGRRWPPRKWPAYLAGTPVFLFFLYFFFENISRLLPANI